MAGGREIKTKIKSVQNTRKVTRALEMVSASKIRKAQDRMKTSRPYARVMRQVIGHLAQAGMSLTPDPELADVLIVNTCSFIDNAKKESIAAIHGAIGIRNVLAEWGPPSVTRSARALDGIMWALGVVLTILGLRAVYAVVIG